MKIKEWRILFSDMVMLTKYFKIENKRYQFTRKNLLNFLHFFTLKNAGSNKPNNKTKKSD